MDEWERAGSPGEMTGFQMMAYPGGWLRSPIAETEQATGFISNILSEKSREKPLFMIFSLIYYLRMSEVSWLLMERFFKMKTLIPITLFV